MDKEQLIVSISHKTGVTNYIAGLVIDNTLEAIKKSVEKGEKVRLAGFGSFEAKKRAPRTGRNPRTNIPIPIPEKYIPSFAPASEFKTRVEKLGDTAPKHKG